MIEIDLNKEENLLHSNAEYGLKRKYIKIINNCFDSAETLFCARNRCVLFNLKIENN